VRNCGSTAVVEGVGDHGCEYMTSGTVIVLGSVGKNFGAGMTGGVAYVYDRENKLSQRLNPQLVRAERLGNADDDMSVKGLIEQHAQATGSAWSRGLLDQWDETKDLFWKVSPK
jgi:glutamate synthase (NADPH/NADH) large chain